MLSLFKFPLFQHFKTYPIISYNTLISTTFELVNSTQPQICNFSSSIPTSASSKKVSMLHTSNLKYLPYCVLQIRRIVTQVCRPSSRIHSSNRLPKGNQDLGSVYLEVLQRGAATRKQPNHRHTEQHLCGLNSLCNLFVKLLSEMMA